ncbi:MAG: SurA N-terminal domain-containing protein, partial [Verrucomicrobiota bacterium]
CIAFIGAYSMGGGSKKTERLAGRINGNDVSLDEFNRATLFAMELRQPRQLDPEMQKMLREETWKRLAALQVAEEMGLQTSVREMETFKRRDPNFQENGEFSQRKFEQLARQRNITVRLYEDYLREQITLAKLSELFQASVWISPMEADRKLRDFTDERTVKCALFEADKLKEDIDLSEQEVEEFYDKNKELFKSPEKVSVKYVSFPYSAMLDQAEVLDVDLETYYTDHPELYTGTNAAGEETQVPFEEVKEDIREILRKEEAAYLAYRKADEFVSRLTPSNPSDEVPSFTKLAEAKDISVSTTELFSAGSNPPAITNNPEFAAAAFALEPEIPMRSFSDPVSGKDSVYVLSADTRQPESVPDLKEIFDEVQEVAARRKQQEVFWERINRIKEKTADIIDENKDFESVIAGMGGNVTTTLTFSAYSEETPDYAHFRSILENTLTLKAGALSNPIRVPEGALLAYVSSRKPGDIQAMEDARAEIRNMVSRYRSEGVMQDWKDYIMGKTDIEVMLAPIEDEEYEQEASAAPSTPRA